MKVPKYIKKMIFEREKAQAKSNELQCKIEDWFEKHDIEVEWCATHCALYNEPQPTRIMYLEALKEYERR